MSLYHFHIHHCTALARDEEGLELPDLAAARREAIAGARSIMGDELAKGRLCLGCHIEIEDGAGLLLATVAFRDAVTITSLGHS